MCEFWLSAMSERVPQLNERDIAAAWNDGLFLGSYVLPGGETIEIVHRGSWTHGFGPDFRNAIISVGGRDLQSGSIELHLRTSGWRAHGHHLDPRYNDVIAHVVLIDDGAETRRADGRLVPTLTLDPARVSLVRAGAPIDWSLVGGDVCAEALTHTSPRVIRDALWRLGDARLAEKSARLEARLAVSPPGEVLYVEILDGLGFSANRDPMRTIAQRVPISAIEALLATVPSGAQLETVRGLLFGVAGFLPISPGDANAARWSPSEVAAVEGAWRRSGGAWHEATLPATEWTRARVRPANNPALRLSAAAAMIAGAEAGLTSALFNVVRQRGELVVAILELSSTGSGIAIGADRATGLAANAVIPFAFALAESNGDQALGEAAAALWERLGPAEANEVTRRAFRQVAGEARLSGLGSRGQQGLIQLDRTLCGPRRCFECPIAIAVVSDRESKLHGENPEPR